MPPSALDLFLKSLPHTGVSGFEGLVARLLEAETGQRFRIASSGQQRGLDVASESGSGNSIKVEAKHYDKSSLDLRELTAELAQVASLGSSIDLWVLVASCPVSQQHEDSLLQLALKLDVEILILDRGNDGLERLSVLMAAQAPVVIDFIDQHGYSADKSSVSEILSQVSNGSSFEPVRAQLTCKLTGTLLGYEDARRRAKKNLLNVLADAGTTEAVFNQRIGIWPPHAGAIQRPGMENKLRDWWDHKAHKGCHLALLGEEGIGKTWAAMAWVAKLVDVDRLPLTLPFSCSTQPIAVGANIENMLPDLLASWTKIGDRDIWSGRLNRWLEESTSVAPLVLIVADGLNECPSFDWVSFFRPLLHQRWRGRILVLTTDRLGHWYPNCHRLELNADRFETLVAPGYDDEELAQALAGKGILLSQIPTGLHELIRTPRYCDLVADHFDEMQQSNDFTRERLILLDARYRQQQRRGFPLSEAEFVEIIRKLAQKFREKPELHSDDIRSIVPDPDRFRKIYQEIVDGGLVKEERVGVGLRYTVERTRLVFGLGMLLADDIRKEADRSSEPTWIAEKISQWLGAQPDMDLKVESAAAAVFHALLEDDYPAIARQELVRHWLSARNRSTDDEEARLAYVLRAPGDFIAITEDFWSSAHNRGNAQRFLAKAFSAYRDDPRLNNILTAAIARWMGFVHPAGPPLLRPNPGDEDRCRSEIRDRVGKELTPGPLELLGEKLTVIEDAGMLRLSRFGFFLMSSGNFGSFARCVVPWSVASAVMGRAMEQDVARWTVRLSEEALDELLIPQIRRLLESGSKIGEKAGHILLDVLGTKAASELLREFPEVESEEARERRLRHEADPCLSIFAWSHEECENCLERSDVPLHLIFAHARDRLIDPTRGVPSQLIARAVTTLQDIDPSKIHENLFHNRELSLFNELVPFIGAHAPDELADYVRSVVRSMPHRNLTGRRQLALWMDEIYPVLGETELTALRSVIDALRAADWPELSPTMRVCLEQEAEGFALCGVLPHLAPGDRYREMMKRPDNALEAAAVYEWLQPVSRESFDEGLGFIHSAADERSLVRSLRLLALARPPLTSFDKDRLVALAHNPNSMIRATILRFVCLSNDEEMGRRLVDVGTKYTEPENQDESYWGTRLLKQYSGSSDFEMLASRVNPAAASHLIEARGCITEEAAFYARSLDAFWRKAIGASASRIDPLPNILIDSGSDCLGTELPKFDVADNSSIRIQDASTSWTSEQTGSLPETFQRWGESFDIQRLRREGENRVKAVMTAWRTDAFALYGRRFSHKALAAIHTVAPDIVRNWVSGATGGGSRREIAFVRLGAFYVDLCEALLRVDPGLGFKLWIALRTARSLVSFNPMQVAFRAPRSEAVDRARWQELNQCTSDESLSCLSCLAQLAKDGWLEETVHRLLNSRFLGRRARGLTLASLAHFDTATFESYVDLANVTGTWVEGTLDTLRLYHWRDQAAWHYYERFLREPSSDRSWAAFRLFIHLTDRRFDVWRKICEASSSPPKDRIKLADISGDLRRVTERCKDREDVLFGMKRQPGEVYPFLE